jgi:hypothetical protein
MLMADKPQHLNLDGVNYDLSAASEEALALIARLQSLGTLIDEKNNTIVLLTKAKNAYIADLKAEIIKSRTGLDLSTLFDPE